LWSNKAYHSQPQDKDENPIWKINLSLTKPLVYHQLKNNDKTIIFKHKIIHQKTKQMNIRLVKTNRNNNNSISKFQSKFEETYPQVNDNKNVKESFKK